MFFRVLYYDRLSSTNDRAKELALRGAPEGTVVLAAHQTKGRGQFERKWHSPRGAGLTFSIIVRPDRTPSQIPLITHFTAKSVAGLLLRRFSLNATLKRPNDVLVNQRKISGVLCETEVRQRQASSGFVVIGIGLNVNTSSKKLVKGATSIYNELNEKQDLGEVFREVLKEFSIQYKAFQNQRLKESQWIVQEEIA